jgi:hypothetical protein
VASFLFILVLPQRQAQCPFLSGHLGKCQLVDTELREQIEHVTLERERIVFINQNHFLEAPGECSISGKAQQFSVCTEWFLTINSSSFQGCFIHKPVGEHL